MKKKMLAILIALTMIMQPLSAVGATEEFSDLPVMEEKQVSTDKELFGDEAEINEGASVFGSGESEAPNSSQDVSPAFSSEEQIAGGDCGAEGDNVNWALTGDNLEGYTLTIAGTGRMDDYYVERPWEEYTNEITMIEVKQGITSIGDCAFINCSNLTVIRLPESLTSIGDNAFDCCGNLSYIDLPIELTEIGDQAFDCCDSLTSIILSEKVTSIGDEAFLGCDDLVIYGNIGSYAETYAQQNNIPFIALNGAVILPDDDSKEKRGVCGKNLTWEMEGNDYEGYTLLIHGTGKMYDYCSASPWHAYCSQINDIVMDSGVESIGDWAFSDCDNLTGIDLPESLTSIGHRAFFDCSSLSSVDLPEGLMSIGDWAFEYCDSLLSINFPGTLINIGDSSFYGCRSLTSINLPEGLTSIGYRVFGDCRDMTSIDLPEELISIGENCFMSCSSLTSINLPESLISIGARAFDGCRSLTSINLPEGLTSIGEGAFQLCESLTGIDLPEGLTSIGNATFDLCSSLISIKLPEGVTSIGEMAFWYCESLTSMELPDSLESIGENAFNGCSSLTSVALPEGLTSIGYGAFEDCNKLTIYGYIGSCAEVYAQDNDISFVALGDTLTGVCGDNGDNVIWTLDGNDTDGYTLIITGEGETNYYFDDYKPWHVYIDKIKKVKVEWGVTCLNSGIFKGCSNLKSIEIADSVSFIKDTAFDEVKNFTIYGYRGSGAEEYAEINNISIIYLDSEQDLVLSGVCGSKGDNVKWSLSGDYSNGYTLTISGTGDMADFDSSDYSINPAPWNSCHNKIINVKVNRGVSRIGNGAFVDCKRLKDINLPDGLTSIGTAAFEYCTSLEKIEIPDGVIGIEDFSFWGCTSLKKVDIPDSVTYIGQWAFRDCSELESVTLPNKIVVLNDYLFYGCRSLKSIIIPDSVKVIWNCVFGSCSSLTSITIPDSVTEIKAGAFPDCILYVSKGSKAEEYAKEYEYTFRYIESAHTHDWNEGTITKEPSCTEAGEKTYTCTSCGETRTEEIPATGHKEVKDTAVAATCETAGKTEGSHCSVCGQVIKKQEEIPTTGHKEVKDTAVAATCETAGKTEGSHCSVCGQVIKKQEEIPAKGHSWSAWKTVTKATVFAPAKQTRTCSVCKKQETRTAAKKLTPTIKLNYTGLILQTRQSTSVVRVSGLANGDSVRSWKSSNTKIVKVDKRGKITAQKTTGKAYITVTLASKKTAKIKVIVQKSAVKTKKLTGLQNKMVLKKGKSITLKPVRYPITSTEKITYATSNKKVVIVNSKGKIKAVAPGKANITVKCGKAKFVIKVGVPRTKTTAISVAKSIKVKKGKSVVLKTKVTPANTDDKTVYASSNKKVATVTSKGVIKGVKKGKAVITVKSGSKSVKCTVTVV